MRQDMNRIKASSVRVGQTLAFPNPSMDQQVWSIYKDGSKIVINEEHSLSSSAYVFIKPTECDSLPVEALPAGEFVRRKADSSKTYRKTGYDRSLRAYQLDDCEDSSRCIYVKKGTVLFFGFTY